MIKFGLGSPDERWVRIHLSSELLLLLLLLLLHRSISGFKGLHYLVNYPREQATCS